MERVEEDVRRGDLASARQRLASHLGSKGYSHEVCQEIARLSWRMGDPVGAGRWYFLCESTDPQAGGAIERFRASCGGRPQQIAFNLPAFCKSARLTEGMPTSVRDRLATVFMPSQASCPAKVKSRLADFFIPMGCLAAIILMIASVVVGAATIIRWVVGLF